MSSVTSALPPGATGNQRAVGNAIDSYLNGGGTLPLPFVSLLVFETSRQIANSFSQLSGEAGTGTVQAGAQAMNSFLSMVIGPFNEANRPFAETVSHPYMVVKGYDQPPPRPVLNPRRWGVWSAVYGGEGNAGGDAFGDGSHDRSIDSVGYATGIDYLVTPDTVAGFAVGGGGTRFGLSDGLGGGHSDMAQVAVYSSTRINAAYLSAAVAYAYHQESTDRYLNLVGLDQLDANFSANNVGGRIEGGYRFALPYTGWMGQYGITPYAAAQAQSFFMPSYAENAVSGSPVFALAYDARTTTTTRSELGAWFDWSTPMSYDSTLVFRGRTAWAHDYWSSSSATAMFEALPGSSFNVFGASPPTNLLLTSADAELWLRNGFSFDVRLDSELADHAQRYMGTGELRYAF